MPERLTDADLDELERLSAAATPGEWRSEWSPEGNHAALYAPVVGLIAEVFGPSDADAIRTAHNAVPALVAEVAALREAALAVLPLLEPVAVGDQRWRRCQGICGYVEVGETHRADCPVGRLAALVGEGQDG